MTLALVDLLDEYAAATDYSLELVEGLTAEQIAWRPNTDSSAIGWHLGHQGAVNHYMVRNLTAAEVTFDAALIECSTPQHPSRNEVTSRRSTRSSAIGPRFQKALAGSSPASTRVTSARPINCALSPAACLSPSSTMSTNMRSGSRKFGPR